MRGRLSLALLSCIALAWAASTGAAQTVKVCPPGCGGVELNGRFAPRELPRRVAVPISAELVLRVPRPGGAPGVLEYAGADFDRGVRVNPSALEICRAVRVRGRETRQARQACPRSIVGTGTAIVDVPGGAEPLRLRVTLFYAGGYRSASRILAHAFEAGSRSGSALVPLWLSKRDTGPYGYRLQELPPLLYKGVGALRVLTLKLRRNGFVLARCRSGALAARVRGVFTDDTIDAATAAQACMPHG